jgi:hypothetical protein
MTLSSGYLPRIQAQKRVVMYDLPARGGSDTESVLMSPSATSWNACAISFKNGRALKKS